MIQFLLLLALLLQIIPWMLIIVFHCRTNLLQGLYFILNLNVNLIYHWSPDWMTILVIKLLCFYSATNDQLVKSFGLVVPGRSESSVHRTTWHPEWRTGLLWPETLETRTPEYVQFVWCPIKVLNKIFLSIWQDVRKCKIALMCYCISRYRSSRCREGEDGDSGPAD